MALGSVTYTHTRAIRAEMIEAEFAESSNSDFDDILLIIIFNCFWNSYNNENFRQIDDTSFIKQIQFGFVNSNCWEGKKRRREEEGWGDGFWLKVWLDRMVDRAKRVRSNANIRNRANISTIRLHCDHISSLCFLAYLHSPNILLAAF